MVSDGTFAVIQANDSDFLTYPQSNQEMQSHLKIDIKCG